MNAYKKPIIGQLVHYKDDDIFAAFVVKICEGQRVNLVVWDGDGRSLTFKNVEYSERLQDRCWSYIE